MVFPPPELSTCGKESQMGKKSAVVLWKPPQSSSVQDMLALVPVEMAFIYLGWIAPCLEIFLGS